MLEVINGRDIDTHPYRLDTLNATFLIKQEELIISQLIKKVTHFMEYEFVVMVTKPATEFYSEPVESSSLLHILFL
jgi:hypothetical protein